MSLIAIDVSELNMGVDIEVVLIHPRNEGETIGTQRRVKATHPMNLNRHIAMEKKVREVRMRG